MKKIRLFLGVAVLCIVVSNICAITGFAAAPAKGLDFANGNYYYSNSTTLTLPSTYEATLHFPQNQTGRGGVIIGTYTENQQAIFNFEIHENGAPRIYVIANDVTFTNYDVKFSEVNVYTGEVVHLAVTVDHTTGTWSCYVDGVLKQTITKSAPTPFELTTRVGLGGDLRSGSTPYFKGALQKVALYKDVRSAQEIVADATATLFDNDNILCAYDLSDNDLGTYPTTVYSKAGMGLYFELQSDWLKDIDEPTDYAYSFAVLGDIQSLTYYYPEKLSMLFEWLKDNAESKKMKFCVGLGDVTDMNKMEEYQRVNRQYSKLLGVVPFSIIRGNHDRDDATGASRMFSKFITQEKYGSEITGSYDDTMLNTYRIIKVGKVKYLFMNLDFILADPVLDWANTIISENKDCRVIVSTHIYFDASGQYYDLGGVHSLTRYGCQNNGQGLWDKVLSKHENVIMLLSGHNPSDDIYYRQKTGDNGNQVTEILIDPQQTDLNHGGVGLVAMFYFSEDGKELQVRYYSTVKEEYFKENNQFSITLDVPETSGGISSIGLLLSAALLGVVAVCVGSVFYMKRRR